MRGAERRPSLSVTSGICQNARKPVYLGIFAPSKKNIWGCCILPINSLRRELYFYGLRPMQRVTPTTLTGFELEDAVEWNHQAIHQVFFRFVERFPCSGVGLSPTGSPTWKVCLDLASQVRRFLTGMTTFFLLFRELSQTPDGIQRWDSGIISIHMRLETDLLDQTENFFRLAHQVVSMCFCFLLSLWVKSCFFC